MSSVNVCSLVIKKKVEIQEPGELIDATDHIFGKGYARKIRTRTWTIKGFCFIALFSFFLLTFCLNCITFYYNFN